MTDLMNGFAAVTMFSLVGQRALVTGGGGGVGRVCSLVLAANGAEVVAVDRRAEEVEGVVEGVRAAGGAASAATVDGSDATEVAQLAAEIEPVQILVNNAGVSSLSAPVHEIPIAE